MTPENKARIVATLGFAAVWMHGEVAHAAPAPVAAERRMDHISVVATGKGSPVILIPGLSTPRAVWDGVTPALAKAHRVYLVQVNGFAGDAPRANLTPGVLDGVVADLHALIVREKIAGASVVGHSLGGLVALELAKAHPGDTGKLMVVDALPFAGAMFGPGLTPAMLQPRAAMMRDGMAASQGKPNAALSKATAERLALKPDSRAAVERWVMATDQRVSGEAMYEDLTTDLRPDLTAITVPITLVYPWSADQPKAQGEALYKAEYAGAPHVTFVDVGDAAHFLMLDQPAAFAAALDAFLKG